MSSLRKCLPPRTQCGIGLRAPHVAEVIATHPDIAWVEVHAENYLCGGRALLDLETVRSRHPVSLHAVGLSLGGAARPDSRHLMRLRELATRIDPVLVSEHLAWSGFDGVYLNELLPLPYTEESLAIAAHNVDETQEVLRRQILIENPSAYLRYAESPIPESEFLAELVRRTGCGILCDVNNVYVSCANLGGDPFDWIDALPAEAVGEIHLAGFCANAADGRVILIDDHGSPVAEPVWDLYQHAVARFPSAPALIEWDSRLPPLSALLAEADKADAHRAAAIGRFDHAAA